MLKTVYEVDDSGFLIDRHVDELATTKYITVDLPNGLFKPRFVNGQWVESATKEEINNITNQPKQPTIESRITELENTLLTILEVL